MTIAAWLAAGLLLLGGIDADDDAPPSAEEIAAQIQRLGDENFAAREEAMLKLWEYGDAAVAALTAARDGNDPEIRFRAELLLRQIALGVRPNMSPEVSAKLQQYKTGDRVARRHAVAGLEQLGEVKLLVRLHRNEEDEYVKGQISQSISRLAQDLVPPLILRRRWEEAEELILHKRQSESNDPTLAVPRFYWATRRIDDGIRRLRGKDDADPPLRDAPDLAALYALQGKWHEVVEQSQRTAAPSLAGGSLLSAAQWTTLADDPPVVGGDAEAAALKRLSSQVLLYELAGNREQSASAVEELRALRTESMPVPQQRLWATRMLILEQFGDAFSVLEQVDPTLAALLRIRRSEFGKLAETLRWDSELDDAWLNALPTRPEQPRETQYDLAMLSARAMVVCGRRDAAHKVVETLARNPLEDRPKGVQFALLAYAALEADQWDRFLDFAEIAFKEPDANTFWQRVAPQQAVAARLWQAYFEGIDFHDHVRLRVTQIAQLSGIRRAPPIEAGELDLLLKAAENSIEDLTPVARPMRVKLVAEASLKHGRRELARAVLERLADDDLPAALLLGDLLAADGNRDEAAEWYKTGWDAALKAAREAAPGRPPRPARVRPRAEPAVEDDPFGDVPRRIRRSELEETPVAAAAEGGASSGGSLLADIGPDRFAVQTLAKNPDALAALYLHGLHTPGEQGKEHKRAALALVPNVEAHLQLADRLLQRGLHGDARSIWELVSRIAPLGSPAHANAMSHLAGGAARADEPPPRVVERWQQTRAMSLLAGATYTLPESYCDLPRSLHLARVRAALAAERFDELPGILDALERAVPADIRTYETLLPLLTEKRRTAELKTLFDRGYAFYRQLLDDFPDSPTFHNQLAWLCAISHRKLDEALPLARRAVELDPQQPAYIDTLAEVHFHLGDRDKAIELSRRALELAPNSPEMQRRLKHFESDPLP